MIGPHWVTCPPPRLQRGGQRIGPRSQALRLGSKVLGWAAAPMVGVGVRQFSKGSKGRVPAEGSRPKPMWKTVNIKMFFSLE